MEILRVCPACKSSKISFKESIKDYFLSGEEFKLNLCEDCELLFTNPRPDESGSAKYYQSEEYISHSNKSKGVFATLYQWARTRNLKWKHSRVLSLTTSGSITDIGCGTGEFLSFMKDRGWETIGFEPDDNARKQGSENLGLNISDLEALTNVSDKSQDIVSLWHVLEHVHQLQERVETIRRILKPGAYAYIALPNPNSPDAKHYENFWAAWDVPRHLYHFSEKSVKALFTSYGFQHVSSHPMKFDSYYVSMLSERYKKSSLASVRGLLFGMISNMKAGNNSEGYSSTLYIFRKP